MQLSLRFLDGIAWSCIKSSMHIASDSIHHRLHVRRNEHVLSFFHPSMCLSTCCILPSNDTQAHAKNEAKHSHDHSHSIQFSSSHASRPSSEPLASPKPRPLLRAHPSPHTKSRASEPNQRHRHPGVSSFTMISHHRPLTRGSRQTRILENARPSGERSKRGFSSSLRNSSGERLESGSLRMTGLRNGYWLVNGDGLGGDRAIGTGRACL